MNGRETIDAGIAGSLTMIFLVSSISLLMWSFYRRYKKLSDRNDEK